MKILWGSLLLVVLTGLLAFGCQPKPANRQKQQQQKAAKKLVISEVNTVHRCKEPRSTICTKEYRPVCAEVDTGVRCFKAPCPSTKSVTRSNACMACADEHVYSYVEGACKTKNK